jgi:hypothetical protein
MSNDLLVRYLARAIAELTRANADVDAAISDGYSRDTAIVRRSRALVAVSRAEEAIANQGRAPGAIEFVETLREQYHGGRQLYIYHDQSWGSQKVDDVSIRFINLPDGVGGEGGGAVAENNRMSFWVLGFGANNAPPPSGKVKVNQSTSSLPRTHTLRAKSGPPLAIAKYLADFLNKVSAEVSPSWR